MYLANRGESGMTLLQKVVLAGVLVAVAGAASSAQAQPRGGEWQIGVMTSVLSYESISFELEQAGTSVDLNGSETNWGIREDALLEAGYLLSSQVVIGMLLRLGGTSSTTEVDEAGSEENSSSEFSLFIGPKIDFMFSDSDLKPFIGAAAGVTSSSENDASDTELSATGFQFLGRAGLRWFAASSFSLDASVAGTFSFVSGGVENAGGLDVDLSGNSFGVALLVGASGWL